MFDLKHYVPVMRWKQAERLALRNLFPNDKSKITPLIEIVPKDFNARKEGKTISVNEILNKKVDEIKSNWGKESFFYRLGIVR